MSAQGNSRGAVRLVAEIAAVLSFGAGVVHISAAGDHTEVPVLFTGFIAVAVLQLVLGALLLWRRPSRPLVAAGLALMVGAIGAWLVSRTVGLPFPEDGHQEPVGFKDGVTVLFELGSIPALLLLLSRELDDVAVPSPRFAGQTLRAVSLMCCVMLVPALALGGGEHHSHEEAVALGLHDEGGAHSASEGHEPEQEHRRTGHEAAGRDSTGHRRKGHGHGGSSRTGGDGSHSDHTLASAPLGTDHEHVGESGPGAPKHHAEDDKKGGHRGGGKHGDRPNGHGRGDDEHGGDHEGGHGEGGGGQGDEPPVSVSYDPFGVCVSGVCLP